MPEPQPRALPNKIATVRLALLPAVGFYLPTSDAGCRVCAESQA